MPQLPVYESPMADRGLQPTDMGVRGAEELAHVYKSVGNELGSAASQAYDAFAQHDALVDTSKLSKDSADAFTSLTLSRNQMLANADPNDPTVTQKWRETVLEPTLEKLGADVNSEHGRQAAEALRDQLRQYFVRGNVVDQSALASEAVHSNFNSAVNAISQAAAADPLSMTTGIGLLSNVLDAQLKADPRIAPEDAARMREELVGPASKTIAMSAAQGWAEKDAPGFLKALDEGKFANYFSGEDALRLRAYARTQGNVNDELVRRQNKEAADSEMAQLQASTIAPDGTIVIPKTLLGDVARWADKYGRLPGSAETAASQARTMIDFVRGIQRDPKAVSDPHVYDDFKNRLTLSSDDPNALTDEQIVKARANGTLSNEDYNFFKGAVATLARDPAYKVAQAQFKTFIKGIRSSITHSNILMGSNDPTGDQKFLQFQQAATDEFERAYKAGNWQQLLDRNTKGSLWYQAVPYMTDQKGATADLLGRVTGAPGLVPAINPPTVKWKPGMSMDDLAKALGGNK